MSKTILNVEGMSCPSCVSHVRRALTLPGVANVHVALADGKVEVDHDATVSSGRLVAALEGAGYDAIPVQVR